MPKSNGRPRWIGNVELVESQLEVPLHWKKPRRIFVNSISDTFHGDVADEWIDRIFAVMALCPQHTFMVLTKRGERMREYFTSDIFARLVCCCNRTVSGEDPHPWTQPSLVTIARQRRREPHRLRLPLPNVWLGVSASTQADLDAQVPHLRETPAAVRFLSLEPMLEELDVLRHLGYNDMNDDGAFVRRSDIGCVIVGGESGPGARPMHPDWARSIRDQCVAAGVPFFFKQWGGWAPCDDSAQNHEHCRRIAISGRDVTHDIALWAGPPTAVPGSDIVMRLIGKKAAGRLLDGREWSELPGVAR